MIGGYNVNSLVEILKGENNLLAKKAAEVLKNIILVYDSANEIYELSHSNIYAKEVVNSWANAEWFINKKVLEKEITCLVFKVDGETNTDDLSPAVHATTRPDIPMHALAMLEFKKPDGLKILDNLKKQNLPIAYVGDVVGTGSSRKSAINSLIWHIGEDIAFVPNKKTGGIIIGSKIAPIFFNTAQDSGALPIEADVSHMKTGDVIKIYPYDGIIKKIEKDSNTEKLISKFDLYPSTLTDEIQAGGRINLMIGRSLTDKIRNKLDYQPSEIFTRPQNPTESSAGFTQAQKIVGKACGLDGVRPGMTCEPIMTTVGSQDTTGPMTRDELKELACLGFTADLVMQSFCHTAAYPKPVDLLTHKELPDFISQRGGVALKPGDGIIHSWLNRMLLPDTVGTGGDSHTRFPLGISFPGGSGIVAFAAAIGVMPLDMPESVLVHFKGDLQEGITLRDVVNAIPWIAIQNDLLTIEKSNKIYTRPQNPTESNSGFTQAQKIVGKACGLDGVRPGMTCEPIMTTVGSQDTTGPMTRDELKELACLGFTADLVMQSFCHTAAYPNPVDLVTHKELPDFISQRGGVALKPGDGIIHSWLNRMLLPDTVGTGGDSHTRFPLGISFPRGSGIVDYAAAIGSMPLNMPESVLIKFKGELLPGITLRDLVNAIPLFAIRKGLLTVEKANKKKIRLSNE